MSVTLRQLEIFNAGVKSCQVTKVVKLLFITQFAVSLALTEVENQLGREHCFTAREETLTSMKEDSLLVCNTGAAVKFILDSQVDRGFEEDEVSNELIKATPGSTMNLY